MSEMPAVVAACLPGLPQDEQYSIFQEAVKRKGYQDAIVYYQYGYDTIQRGVEIGVLSFHVLINQSVLPTNVSTWCKNLYLSLASH